ncbi:MAG: glycosyltransferase family 2 protein [Acidimicrobiales bacterium]
MSSLTQLTNGPDIAPAALVVVTCVRNEALRLPDFLAHHRRLGVSSFLIIDNASDDGTTEFLTAQDDVRLYHTNQPYSESGCGIDWQNAVLADAAVGHWTLILDADELFIFPGYERTSLTEFVNWVSERRADAVAAPMLDMYPNGPIANVGYQPGASLLETCPWFDSTGYSRQSIAPGLEVIHRGGPRKRLFWDGRRADFPSPVLHKIPLVRWQTRFSLTASTHALKGATLAKATGLLLHFKFLQDFANNADSESRRAEHFMGARQYVAYREVLAADTGLTAFHDGSVRFSDSRKLVELKLMSVPKGYPFVPAAVNTETNGVA